MLYPRGYTAGESTPFNPRCRCQRLAGLKELRVLTENSGHYKMIINFPSFAKCYRFDFMFACTICNVSMEQLARQISQVRHEAPCQKIEAVLNLTCITYFFHFSKRKICLFRNLLLFADMSCSYYIASRQLHVQS